MWSSLHPVRSFLLSVLFLFLQAVRLIRVVRLFKVMKDFVSKIIGDSVRMLTVVLIVAIFLVSFAVVSMVLVGYLRPEPGCERIGSERFRDFFHVSRVFATSNGKEVQRWLVRISFVPVMCIHDPFCWFDKAIQV